MIVEVRDIAPSMHPTPQEVRCCVNTTTRYVEAGRIRNGESDSPAELEVPWRSAFAPTSTYTVLTFYLHLDTS